MTLDRSTYEAWLLDRIEGNLTPEQERELTAFLAANPDLPVTLDDLPSVGGVDVAFSAKDQLKKDHPPAGSPDAARLDDFLAARLEKDLSAEQEQQLDRYLFEHPEAAQEAKRMAASRVAREPIAFPAKAMVERHFPPHGLPDAHRLTDFLIAAEEGDLNKEQRAGLDRYIAVHPEAGRERKLVQAARIERTAVVFANKEHLKKREGRVIALWPRLAAAASIALLVGFAWWMLREEHPHEAPVAQHEEHARPTIAPAVPAGRTQEQPRPVVSHEGASEHPVSANAQGTKRQEQGRGDPDTTPEQPGPVIDPRQQDTPQRMPEVLPEPQLAQAPALGPESTPNGPSQGNAVSPAAAEGAGGSGQTLGTLMANAVRDEVLDEPERNTGLDGSDAVAAMDKGLGALTGGQGGLQVQHQGARERVHLRLGRNLAISASRSR